MGEPLLSIRDLQKSFGALRASNGIAIDVAPGEFRAIIGPNGAGKSTFFNLVSGFLVPDGGQIRFAGKDITGLKPYRLFRVGMSRTFQITSIFSDLSVIENLQLVLLSSQQRVFDVFHRSRRMMVGECERLLALTELDVDLGRPAATLSHGDQKKLELAVALANKPRLLLLDEPTAGMAVNERLDSIRMVHRIAKDTGVTVVFTEHDMQVVFDVADRISVLHQGTIIADDLPENVRASERVQQVYLGESTELTP